MRALGVSRLHVVQQIVLEGVVITLAGAIAGLGLGLVTARYLNGILVVIPGTADCDRLLPVPAESGVDCAWIAVVIGNRRRYLSIVQGRFASDRDHTQRGSNRLTERKIVVEARQLARDYDFGAERVHALRGVSFAIGEGEYVAIVGPSGCGKSTLLNLIGAIDSPTSGSVSIDGKDAGGMNDRDATLFRLRNIGFVFQRFYLMPTLSARRKRRASNGGSRIEIG